MSVTNGSALAESGGGGRKRSTPGTRRRTAPMRGTVEPSAELAAFRGLAPEPAAVEMWPVEAAMWLDPELRVALPRPGDLRIERRSTIASPAAAVLVVTPATGRAALECPEWSLPTARIMPPGGDLGLLGWDARAVSKFREAL